MQTNDNNTDFQSDYDAEWGELDSTSEPEERLEDDEVDETSDDAVASSKEAGEESQESPADGNSEAAANSSESDIWADAPEELRREYLKVQNQYNSMLGRYRKERERSTETEQQLSEYEQKLRELEEQSRQPTQFEQDHPDYAKDVQTEAERIARKILEEDRLKAAQQDAQKAEESAVETILNAHPDAGNIWNDEGFHNWLQQQSVEVETRLQSSDPQDTIEVLNEYKASLSQQREEQLNSLSSPRASASKPDTRAELSPLEEYEAEWEID